MTLSSSPSPPPAFAKNTEFAVKVRNEIRNVPLWPLPFAMSVHWWCWAEGGSRTQERICISQCLSCAILFAWLQFSHFYCYTSLLATTRMRSLLPWPCPSPVLFTADGLRDIPCLL